MLSAIKSLFSSPACRDEAHKLYVGLVTQARSPFFYDKCAVSDTVDGRFDVIVLHMFMVIHRLRVAPQGSHASLFIRALQEVFFADMDRSVREMGSTDTGVGKRIKKMAQAFYGRLQAYEQGLQTDTLSDSLVRNLYRGKAPDDKALAAIMDYVLRNMAQLDVQETDILLAGMIKFSA